MYDHWEEHTLDCSGTFVGKVMSLLFNVLSRFVIDFLPRSTDLLISWLPSPSAVSLEPKKISLSLFLFSRIYLMGLDAMSFKF